MPEMKVVISVRESASQAVLDRFEVSAFVDEVGRVQVTDSWKIGMGNRVRNAMQDHVNPKEA